MTKTCLHCQRSFDIKPKQNSKRFCNDVCSRAYRATLKSSIAKLKLQGTKQEALKVCQ